MAHVFRQVIRGRIAAPNSWLRMVRPRQTAESLLQTSPRRSKVDMAATSIDRKTRSATASTSAVGTAMQQGPPAVPTKSRGRASRQQRARAIAPPECTIAVAAATQSAMKEEPGSHAITRDLAERGEPKRKRQRSKGKQAAAAEAVELEVTATAVAAAKGAVKRRRGRKVEEAVIEIEELLETAEEEATKEDAAAAKPKRARKKVVKEDDLNAVLVDLPTAVPAGKLVGCHVSAAAGVERALVNAASIGEAFSQLCHTCNKWLEPLCAASALCQPPVLDGTVDSNNLNTRGFKVPITDPKIVMNCSKSPTGYKMFSEQYLVASLKRVDG